MTEKLKTLKDLKWVVSGWNDTEVLDAVKAEAIKWYHRSDDNKHLFIRYFFNLTEEEIKKGSSRNITSEDLK